MILLWSIYYYYGSIKSMMALSRSTQTVAYVCLCSREQEQTLTPSDKRACLASTLWHLALAKIPFSLNNMRRECEKDA